MRQFDIGMSPVTVDRNNLILIVKGNRDRHRETFVKACAVFKERAIAQIEDLVSQIKAGKVRSLHIPLPVPEEHTEDYDRALRMLDMHTGSTIELTEDAYRCLVDDEWGWRHSFLSNTVAYTSEYPRPPEAYTVPLPIELP